MAIGNIKDKTAEIDAIPTLQEAINTATAKTPLVDTDTFPLTEPTTLKKTLWSTIKSTLKTYFDGLYLALTGGTLTGDLTIGSNTAGKNLTLNATLGSELAPALTGNSGTNWTLSNTTGYVQPFNNSIEKTGNGTGTITPTAVTNIVIGTTYKVVIVVDSISGTTLYVSFTGGGSYSTTTEAIFAAGTYTYYFTALTTAKILLSPATTALRCKISSISIKAYTNNTGDIITDRNIKLQGAIQNGSGVNAISITPVGTVNLINGATSWQNFNIAYGKSVAFNTNLAIGQAVVAGMQMQFGLLSYGCYMDAWSTYLSLCTNNTRRLHILNTGLIGIGTTAPDKQLEINSADGNCLRLTYNDSNGSATYYVDFNVSAAGLLTINASGGIINTANDIEITDTTKGIILKSPDGSRWRVTVDNSGNLITTSI